MSFVDQMQNDLRLTILNTNEFAESVVYKKAAGYDYLVDKDGNNVVDIDGYPILVNQSEPEDLSIQAIVVRSQLGTTLQNDARNLNRDMEIFILNDLIYGVTEVKKGMDKISVPVQVGGAAVEFNVADIIDKDDVAFHLLLMR